LILKFQEDIAKDYTNSSQKIRVMSESWVGQNAYCVACGAPLIQYENNKPVNDFYCNTCSEDYELKSQKGISNKIMDGAYKTMIEKIGKNEIPNFFYLNYSSSFEIYNLATIPKHYFTEDIIEKRKPLSQTARRAGWVGCNINLSHVPESGKIYLIKNSIISNKQEVLDKFNKTIFLREYRSSKMKGWTLDIMKCVDLLSKKEFSLDEIYHFEESLKQKHPNNENIRPKIRQQLQILRDNNYIEFVGKGQYKLR